MANFDKPKVTIDLDEYIQLKNKVEDKVEEEIDYKAIIGHLILILGQNRGRNDVLDIINEIGIRNKVIINFNQNSLGEIMLEIIKKK